MRYRQTLRFPLPVLPINPWAGDAACCRILFLEDAENCLE
jgi:hypothetical protein